MKKYAISREFFPWNLFAPPISEKFLAMAVPHMKPPKFLWKDKELDVTTHEFTSYDGGKILCFVLSPWNLPDKAPCLMYFHGGGFVLEAAGYHYSNAMRYAKEVGCKVVFPLYRLAPQHPFPAFFEDCYASFCWAYEPCWRTGNRHAAHGCRRRQRRFHPGGGCLSHGTGAKPSGEVPVPDAPISIPGCPE